MLPGDENYKKKMLTSYADDDDEEPDEYEEDFENDKKHQKMNLQRRQTEMPFGGRDKIQKTSLMGSKYTLSQ